MRRFVRVSRRTRGFSMFLKVVHGKLANVSVTESVVTAALGQFGQLSTSPVAGFTIGTQEQSPVAGSAVVAVSAPINTPSFSVGGK